MSAGYSLEPSLGQLGTSLLVKVSEVLKFACLLHVLLIVLIFLGNFLSANLFILSYSKAIRNVRLPRLNFPYGKLQYKKEKVIRGE